MPESSSRLDENKLSRFVALPAGHPLRRVLDI
jgi:hypothetical protein